MNLGPGMTVATYRIERLLGRGGMGEVYLATDSGLGRKVALKLLAPELAADERFRARFIDESRLAASLDHPHIVPIYEAGQTDGRLFIAMRYVEGDDLGALIERDGALEPILAIDLLSGIAQALDAAHDRGLVHRDVKPANILVSGTSRDAHSYLADFGLTKQQGSGVDFTRPGQLVGSIDYVAPEQIEGRPIDGRVDVYSLACVLYTALTGQPPYPRQSEVATLWAHIQADPPRPSVSAPALAAYDPVIARGMAKDPADRTPSAGELLADARQVLAGDGAAAGAGTRAGATRARDEREEPGHGARGAPTTAPNNLPVQLSTFIGRADELRDLGESLPGTRLLTLTGPGGTGKTRLALQAAFQTIASFRDGAYLVELASITDPAVAPSQVAAVLGVPEQSGQSIEETLGAFLEPKRMLLLLDNLEQIPGVAPFVGQLLARCPTVHILATSRAPLHLRGETDYAVQPLGVPDRAAPPTADAIGESDAVALFAARASATRADFAVTDGNAATIAAICIRVDGLPLAVELAAARVKVLSPSQILSRLDDRLGLLTGGSHDLPERQQTLRSTIAWSHDLLAEPEQVLFRRLSIFDGGLTFAAAEGVCVDPGVGNVLESMTALVDGSLLRPIATDDDHPRFAMLETIRQFAGERLAASGESETIAGRHFDHFFELGRRFEEGLGTEDLGAWLHRLDIERPNLIAATEWAVRAGEFERAAQLIEYLRDYTRARGRTAEARALIEAILATPDLEDARRGRLLHESAVLATRQGDLVAADRIASEALVLARRVGDARGAVGASQLLAIAASERGDDAAEARFVQEMLQDADRSGDPRMEILARSHVALRSLRVGAYDEAATYYDEILTRMRDVDVMRESLGATFFNRGLAELHAGRPADAATSLAESAAIGRSMEDPDLLGYVLEGYAALAAAVDRPDLAARLQGACDAALAEAGSALEAFEARMRHRTEGLARAALGETTYKAERSEGAAMRIGDALELALGIDAAIPSAKRTRRSR